MENESVMEIDLIRLRSGFSFYNLLLSLLDELVICFHYLLPMKKKLFAKIVSFFTKFIYNIVL